MKKCKVKNSNCSKYYAKGYCCKHYTQLLRHGKISKRTRFDPNEIVDCGNYYEIVLYNNKCEEVARTKIDKEDVEKAKKYKWLLNDNGYARNAINKLYLHILIIEKKKGLDIDHINHDILDNRKQNLRHCTKSQNSMNQKMRSDNKSGIIGVKYNKEAKRWIAEIKFNKKRINLGCFKNKEDARKVRRDAEIKYFEEFRYNN